MAKKKLDYRTYARRIAKRYGLNPDIFERQIDAESGFDPKAGSGAGAIGIAQFMPATAKGMGINPRDPYQALAGAARMMAQSVKKYGSYEKALRAYNAGEGAIEASHGYGETNAYVAKILQGHDPGGLGKPGKSPAKSSSSSQGDLEGVSTLDTAGLENARGLQMLATTIEKHQAGGSILDSLTGGSKKVKSPLGDEAQQSPLFKTGVLSTDAVNPADFVKTELKRGEPKQELSVPDGGGSDPKAVKGTANFEGHEVAAWIKPYLVYARKRGWKGTITSGFRSFAKQTEIYNSGVRPAAKPGTSNHEGSEFPRGAVDVSDAVGLDRILRKYPNRKLIFAGSKDPVHFSYPHGGSY